MSDTKVGADARTEADAPGDSMRDRFALKFMEVFLTVSKADSAYLTLGAAKDAYILADYMLEAREWVKK